MVSVMLDEAAGINVVRQAAILTAFKGRQEFTADPGINLDLGQTQAQLFAPGLQLGANWFGGK